MTSRHVHPTGLWIYCASGAVAAPTETVATLRRCGASLAIAMIEGITPGGSQRMPTVTVARFVDACRAANIAVILCSFPDVLAGMEGLLRSRDHLADLGDLMHCRTQLDAEPRRRRKPGGAVEVVHWTPALLSPWRHIADLSITTTRTEAPHLGAHDRLCLAQLEQPSSFDTVGSLDDDRDRDALDVFARYSAPEDIVLVGGAFDLGRDVRTAEDLRHDYARAKAQAKLSGAYALWDAKALGRHPELCDAAREIALAA